MPCTMSNIHVIVACVRPTDHAQATIAWCVKLGRLQCTVWSLYACCYLVTMARRKEGHPPSEGTDAQRSPDYGFVSVDWYTDSMLHSLSRETATLPANASRIVYDANGFGAVVCADGARVPFSELFAQEVYLKRSGHVECVSKTSLDVIKIDGSKFQPTAAYLDLHLERQLRVLLWQFGFLIPGSRLWWDLPSLGPLLNPASDAHTNAFINNHWSRWAATVGKSFPLWICLRKAVDRSGRLSDWHRCLREASASTVGLLSLLVYRATHAPIHDGSRQLCKDNLAYLLEKFIGHEPFEVTIVMSHLDEFALGHLPREGARAVLYIENLVLGLKPLVDEAPEEVATSLSSFLETVSYIHGAHLESISLVELLVATFGHREHHWLHRQLLSETAIAIEAFLDFGSLSRNPLDGEGAFHGSRWDQQIIDSVILGDGASGTKRASFPAQHARSFFTLARARAVNKRGVAVQQSRAT